MDEHERLAQTLNYQMPWLQDLLVWRSSVPLFRRHLAEVLSAAVTEARWRHVLIVGPRRVGKTVVMQQVVDALLGEHRVPVQRVGWLRLDHPELRVRSLGELVNLVLFAAEQSGHPASREEPLFLFLDEVTRADDWDLWLKTFHDDRYPVRIIATSSATTMLRQFRRESGAGRWREIDLPPWLFHEVSRRVGADLSAWEEGRSLAVAATCERDAKLAHLDVTVQFWGFPEHVPDVEVDDPLREVLTVQSRVRDEVISNAIYKDLLLQVGIREPEKLERLFTLLAGQVTGLVSSQSLAQTLGVSQPTVDRYIAHLESTHLVFQVPCYAGSEETKARRGRKIYFADGGLRNAALQVGWLAFADPTQRGVLRENAVAAHLYALARRTGVRLYYWRQGKLEVDFVVDHPQEPFAVEVASSDGHTRKGLRAFVDRYPRFSGRTWVTWPGAPFVDASTADDGIGSISLVALLVAVGLRADAALDTV